VGITYIRLAQGFVYLVAIIDWYSRTNSRRFRRSPGVAGVDTMDASFCVDCLDDALKGFGKPEISDTDQGSQFTSESWLRVLKDNAIPISMDGRGRALDNIFVERLSATAPALLYLLHPCSRGGASNTRMFIRKTMPQCQNY
jgi:putative transposase